jgi:hypothetical protein
MASLTSVDKTLSRLSTWMSAVAFAGWVGLAFLPAHNPPSPPTSAAVVPPTTKSAPQTDAAAPAAPAPRAAPPASIAHPSVAAPPTAAPTTTPSTAAPAAGAVPPAVPPDVWTPEEIAAGLRQCVQLLGPASADIALEEPMKKGQCGTPTPLALRSAGGKDKVEFSPAPTMNCRLAASLSEWVDKVLQPAAQEVLGSRITKILGAGSYSCRNIYNNPKLSLSEHATGNAVDVAAFVTADGRTVTVRQAWGPTERDIAVAKKKAAEKLAKQTPAAKADETAAVTPTPSIEAAGKKADAKKKGRVEKTEFKQDTAKQDKPVPAVVVDLKPATTKEAAFLKRLHHGSCGLFATVLGPEANEAHRDHFHLDMKVRRSPQGVCH